MAKGQESIGFEALKTLLEKAQQKPLDQHKIETVDGVTWWALNLTIPGAKPPAHIDLGPHTTVIKLASVHYCPKGVVDAKEVRGLRDGTKGALIRWSGALAAADGFTDEAMKVFRRSKYIDYVSETHWPTDWPTGTSVPESK